MNSVVVAHRIITEDPLVLEFDLSNGIRLKVSADLGYEFHSDYVQDHIATAIKRMPDAESVRYWLAWFEFQLIQSSELLVDPFEQLHDAMKEKGATDNDIAKAWIASRSPAERNELLRDCRQEALRMLVRRCQNLRAKRRKLTKR